MAYVHVAHDCHVGNDTIFGNLATLGGHVTVEEFVNISAGSAVHQFCRVGRHAFIGGYSVVTKDALPFARTVGSRPARIFGTNTIGLMRRGFSPEVIVKLKRSFRYLLQSKLNTTSALQQIEQDASLACPEVQYLVDFIRSSQRGVILRRAVRRTDEVPSPTNSPPADDLHHDATKFTKGTNSPSRLRDETLVKLGLIAGNGRFPFLVLDAARGARPRRHHHRA